MLYVHELEIFMELIEKVKLNELRNCEVSVCFIYIYFFKKIIIDNAYTHIIYRNTQVSGEMAVRKILTANIRNDIRVAPGQWRRANAIDDGKGGGGGSWVARGRVKVGVGNDGSVVVDVIVEVKEVLNNEIVGSVVCLVVGGKGGLENVVGCAFHSYVGNVVLRIVWCFFFYYVLGKFEAKIYEARREENE